MIEETFCEECDSPNPVWFCDDCNGCELCCDCDEYNPEY